MAVEALAQRPAKCGCGVAPAREQNDRVQRQRRIPCKRCFALAAAGLAGYFASRSSSVLRAPRRSPLASCELAIFSIPSGALELSGHADSSFSWLVIAF